MKKIAVLSAATLFALPFSSMAQTKTTTETKPINRISVKDVFIQSSSFNYRNNAGVAFSDFMSLAPQSSILNSVDQNKLNSYNQGGYYNYYSYNSNNMLSGSLGFQFADKDRKSYKSNPLLRIGMSYSNSTAYSGYFSTTDRKAADTLTSSQNGTKVYVDSVNTSNYSANYSSEQIQLNASLIFRTNPAARWSLYSGIGFSVGYSINANTRIDYYKTDYLESRFPNGSTAMTPGAMGYENENNKSEQFKNKRNRTSSLYIPLGIDFRIGNKSEFWKRMHLYYEIKAGINRTNIKELGKYTNVGVQQGLGIRYSWE